MAEDVALYAMSQHKGIAKYSTWSATSSAPDKMRFLPLPVAVCIGLDTYCSRLANVSFSVDQAGLSQQNRTR